MGALAQLDRAEIDRRLNGDPGERAAFLRMAAQEGSLEAQAVLGQLLLDGDTGVAADPPSGFDWFVKAAQGGHLLALNMVGRCYDQGWGTPIDKPRAAQCFRVAAERGLDWGLYNWATALALGDGVEQDRAQALDWFERAARLGNAKAINFVGSFHEDGWVHPRDMVAAAQCYEKAAMGGDFRGMFNHARMLIDADRQAEALYWLRQCGRAANVPFRAKAAQWLAASPLGERGIAALGEGAPA